MNRTDDKISNIQVVVFVVNVVLGIGILSLPSSVAKFVQNDAWILVLIAGIVNIAMLYIICRAGQYLNGNGIVEDIKKLYGKVIGIILLVPVLMYMIGFSAFEIRIFAETAKTNILKMTPIEYIIIPMLLLTAYITWSNISAILRFYEAVTPIIVLVTIVLLVIPLNGMDWSNLRPFLSAKPMGYIKGMTGAAFAFSGYQLLLIVFPYIRSPKKAFKFSLIGFAGIIILYTLVTMECLAKLGPKQTESLIYPALNMIRISEIPGAFIERTEGLLLTLWVLFAFNTLAATVYSGSIIIKDTFYIKNEKIPPFIMLPFIYVVSLWPRSVVEAQDMVAKMSMYLGLYISLIFPVLIIIAGYIKRRGRQNGK